MTKVERMEAALREFGLAHKQDCPNYPNVNPCATECACGMIRAARAIRDPKVYGEQWPDQDQDK